MSNLLDDYLINKIAGRKQVGNFRQLSKHSCLGVDFCSSDYLSFSRSKELFSSIDNSKDLNGATGARLLSGNTAIAEELEGIVASFHQTESALLYNSGYTANLGLLSAIANRHTVFLYDELCHASIIDGIKLSQASAKFKFKHNDTNHLEHLLEKNKGKPICVIVESVYSMDGDFAPLEELASIANKNNVALIVDEAHATGVYGNKGEGRVQALGLQDEVWARVHTFGKALGLHGAAVVGSPLLIQALMNLSRPFIYTTGLAPDTLRKIKAVYEHLEGSTGINIKLHTRINYFREKVIANSGKWMDSASPIQALLLPSNSEAKSVAKHLQEYDICVYPILSPTVPEGTERLRISIHAHNTREEIDLLFEVINKYLCQRQ